MLISKLAVPNTWHGKQRQGRILVLMPIAFLDGSNWKRNRQRCLKKIGEIFILIFIFTEVFWSIFLWHTWPVFRKRTTKGDLQVTRMTWGGAKRSCAVTCLKMLRRNTDKKSSLWRWVIQAITSDSPTSIGIIVFKWSVCRWYFFSQRLLYSARREQVRWFNFRFFAHFHMKFSTLIVAYI